MAAERLSMRQTREILRQKWTLGRTHREVAQSLGIGLGTVSGVERRARALQEAKLKLPHAAIEAVDYPARRELDKSVIRQLATCRWVQEHHNVILVGATGVGKSFLACALAHQACRKGYRAASRRASRLFHELTLARADGSYVRLLAKLARLDVLVIDDWGLAPVQDAERRDLLEILEDRYGTRRNLSTRMRVCRARSVNAAGESPVQGGVGTPVHLGSYPGDGKGDRPVEAPGTEIRLGRVSERTGRNASEA